METKFGGKLHNFYGPVVSEVGKKSTEWDLNDWKWDGDLFMASPLNPAPTDCTSRQPFNNDEMMIQNEREKRRRVVEVENEEAGGSLNLKLGHQEYPLDESEGKSGKKTKVSGIPSSRAVCQVEDCKADLSTAKDYHRRHKVCDVHSKATSALVANVVQRFCQQCSRFHVLQEFDEGKRSCRRRLAGHNRRRRKTHPENVLNAANQNDERGSNYLLISLLRILSNLQFNSSDQTKDQDLLSHLLKNLASVASTTNERNHTEILPVSQDMQNVGTSLGAAQKDLPTTTGLDASVLTKTRALTDKTAGGVVQNASTSVSPLVFRTNASNSVQEKTDTIRRTQVNNIDLNNEYDGSQDCLEEGLPDTCARKNLGDMSPAGPLWLYKDSQRSSPPQNSGNSGSTSSQSPSTSSGETQSRTDRIVFKLFGKDPNDFPLVLRKQILDWLSSSPTDMESYIRPGCIILTIYLRMEKSSWDRLYCDLTSSLRRLLDSSTDPFWRTGWIYARVQHRVTFMYNGQVVLDTPLPVKNHQSCRISSIKPIAVTVSEGVQFVVKGYNFSHSTARLLCTLEGKFLIQENCADMRGGADSSIEHDEIQSFSFSCAVPDVIGRGFIEVEDYGLSSSFFPFIVAEKDVCSEICTLESLIELADAANPDSNALEIKNKALDFIHEMGWLLHRSHLKVRLGDVDPFPFERLRWLIEFSIDHDWCAVVKKLLSAVFDGIVDLGQEKSNIQALLDIGLVHRAVRRNCVTMVAFLLSYHLDKTGEHKLVDEDGYLFRPDAMGPGGLTPLHIAASLDSCENVVDALTEDPGSVGIEAWKSARDSSGLTPHDYACLRGHYSYIHLVQRKLNKKPGKGHVVVDIPGVLDKKQKVVKYAPFESEKQCRQCEQKLVYARRRGSVNIYRPAMVSLVAIAAVCVCTALLFKSSPEVFCSFHPFRWELLKYGSQ
ncbi:squamosa promoter-binding-like protein 1 [Salvia miltiorrhiza]|uniref:squamosa promoter-binding-like protein 1 n=1 Tax=Salvia miltiorrhiza TaxID=226208 RepID=UPI0025AC17F4|nr:squamosa promoter-binding-like protein 1 [Salvia miltiorrhiza]